MTVDIRKADMKKNIEAKLKEYMDNCEAHIYMINLLDPALATWEGKQITKRLITRLRMYIPEDFHLYLRKTYWGTELTMSKGNKTLTLQMAKDKEKKLDMAYIREKNASYYKQAELYKTYAGAIGQTDGWLDEYMKIRQEVVDLKEKMGKYGCNYLIDWRYID